MIDFRSSARPDDVGVLSLLRRGFIDSIRVRHAFGRILCTGDDQFVYCSEWAYDVIPGEHDACKEKWLEGTQSGQRDEGGSGSETPF